MKKKNPKKKATYNPKSGEDAYRIAVKLSKAMNDHYKKFGSLSVGATSVQIITMLLAKLAENDHWAEIDMIARRLVKMAEGQV